MIIAIAVLAALLIGFLAGHVSFKKTNEYCAHHGVTRTCPICPSQPTVSARSQTTVSARSQPTVSGAA